MRSFLRSLGVLPLAALFFCACQADHDVGMPALTPSADAGASDGDAGSTDPLPQDAGSPVEDCVPTACAETDCGSRDDGCGGTIDCGPCEELECDLETAHAGPLEPVGSVADIGYGLAACDGHIFAASNSDLEIWSTTAGRPERVRFLRGEYEAYIRNRPHCYDGRVYVANEHGTLVYEDLGTGYEAIDGQFGLRVMSVDSSSGRALVFDDYDEVGVTTMDRDLASVTITATVTLPYNTRPVMRPWRQDRFFDLVANLAHAGVDARRLARRAGARSAGLGFARAHGGNYPPRGPVRVRA